MENKLGRKSMQDWQDITEALTTSIYKSGFKAGYDAAKDETPDIDEMANILINRYTDDELGELRFILDHEGSQKPIESANEQRAELIQRAREFVNELFVEGHDGVGRVVWDEGGHKKVEFIVNKEKRTVVVLLNLAYVDSKNKRIGIAKCMPDEVFNADIGKAIALARALEIEIPQEFIYAVQPDEVVIGHIIESSIISDLIAEVLEWRPNRDHAYPNGKAFGHTHDSGFLHTSRVTIIDDTNAQYGR